MLAIGENKSKISSDLDDFKRSKVDLLIISYTQALRCQSLRERERAHTSLILVSSSEHDTHDRNIDVLCDTKELDLIICDEGHRLKVLTLLACYYFPFANYCYLVRPF